MTVHLYRCTRTQLPEPPAPPSTSRTSHTYDCLPGPVYVVVDEHNRVAVLSQEQWTAHQQQQR